METIHWIHFYLISVNIQLSIWKHYIQFTLNFETIEVLLIVYYSPSKWGIIKKYALFSLHSKKRIFLLSICVLFLCVFVLQVGCGLCCCHMAFMSTLWFSCGNMKALAPCVKVPANCFTSSSRERKHTQLPHLTTYVMYDRQKHTAGIIISYHSRRASLDDAILILGQILIALKTHNFIPEVQLEGLRASLVLLNPGWMPVCFLFLVSYLLNLILSYCLCVCELQCLHT